MVAAILMFGYLIDTIGLALTAVVLTIVAAYARREASLGEALVLGGGPRALRGARLRLRARRSRCPPGGAVEMELDVFHNLATGFAAALSLKNLGFALLGCLLGTLIGVLPGIGPIPAIAMLLPITFGLEPLSSLIMLAGIYYGAQYGGSTTSILVNIPGEAGSIVTTLDGHPMARQGRAGAALGVAALGSFFAGCVGTVFIAAFGPPLAALAQEFNSPDYFSLMVLGLVTAVVLAHGSVIKAVGMVLVGLLLGLVGTDVNSGLTRYTFGISAIWDGIDFLPLVIGLFGIVEIIRNLEQRELHRVPVSTRIRDLWPSRQDFPDVLAPGAARHRAGLAPRHPAGRRRRACRVRELHAREEDRQGPEPVRQRRDRGRGGAGIRQQCRRADLVHSAADARPAVQCGHGADDGRDDHPGHSAGFRRDDQAAGPVLGHGRQHVDRQRHAAGDQSAADRDVGAAAVGAVPAALPGDPAVLRDRRVQHQHQRRANGDHRRSSRCSATFSCGSDASRRRWCWDSSSGR